MYSPSSFSIFPSICMPASDSGIKGSHLHFMDNDGINAFNSTQKIHMILPNMIQTQQGISVTKK